MKQKGFSVILILVGIVLVVVMVGGAYYLGTKNNKSQNSVVTPNSSSSPTSTPSVDSQVTPTPTPTVVSQTLDTTQWLTYKSPSFSASVGSSPVAFSIKYPSSWKVGYDNQPVATSPNTYGDGFIFTYNDYQIKIAKGYAPGGNECESSDIKVYTEFNTVDSQHKFRRVKAYEGETIKPGTIIFTICSTIPGYPKMGYVSNSEFGKISYTLPQTYDNSTLNIMDNITTTLLKLQ